MHSQEKLRYLSGYTPRGVNSLPRREAKENFRVLFQQTNRKTNKQTGKDERVPTAITTLFSQK